MNESWLEISVKCDPLLEESVCWRIDEFGCSGTAVEIKDGICLIRFYIPQVKFEVRAIETLADLLKQDAVSFNLTSQPTLSWLTIENEDWSHSWKQYWHPTPIGENFVVYPAWLTLPEKTKDIILRLDPGSAFGTGTHPTTALCLESLEIHLIDQLEPMVIADIGCGSGILSIGALLLGAHKLYAVDEDILAITATESNALLNSIDLDSLYVAQGSAADLVQILPQGFDLIVCNILAEVLVDLMKDFTKLLKPNGRAILSGLITSQVDYVSQSAKEHGYLVSAIRTKNSWCCLEIYLPVN